MVRFGCACGDGCSVWRDLDGCRRERPVRGGRRTSSQSGARRRRSRPTRSRSGLTSGPVSSASSKAAFAWSPWPSGVTARSPRSTSGPELYARAARGGYPRWTLRPGESLNALAIANRFDATRTPSAADVPMPGVRDLVSSIDRQGARVAPRSSTPPSSSTPATANSRGPSTTSIRTARGYAASPLPVPTGSRPRCAKTSRCAARS